MRKHTFGRIAATAAIAAGLALGGPALAVAEPTDAGISTYGDIADTGFGFNLGSGQKRFTEYREKEDSTSVYVKFLSLSDAAPRMLVYGATNGGGLNPADCTHHACYAKSSGEYEIWNLVRENGRTWACLGARGERGKGKTSGVWSPDCLGSFPVL